MSPSSSLEERLSLIGERGVEVVDPRQTYIGPDVDLSRISPGSRLFPGARLSGACTYVGNVMHTLALKDRSVLQDAVIGPASVIGSGFIEDSVLLGGAKMAANVHIRPGCLFEEEVVLGHTVGLKQTVLLSFVTLGSVINFCDVLMAGGGSRRDHSRSAAASFISTTHPTALKATRPRPR